MNPNEEQRLTAYALGELPPEERQKIEQDIQSAPEKQQYVAEIQALAHQLENELADEPPMLELTAQQRDALLQTAGEAAASRKIIRFPWRPLISIAAAAAVVALVFGGLYVSQPVYQTKVKLAKADRVKGQTMIIPAVVMEQADFEEELEMLDNMPSMEPTDAESMIASAPEVLDGSLLEVDTTAPSEELVTEFAALDIQTASSPLVMKGLHAGRSSVGRKSKMMSNRLSQRGNGLAAGVIPCRIIPAPLPESPNTESYASVEENVYRTVQEHPLSTFSIDVDTASYANIRRFLKNGSMPPKDAVRVEEMINYFNYNYAPPQNDVPFAVHIESAACPWNTEHQLVKIGLKGRELDRSSAPACNLVFLLDVSGSMQNPNKLPLVQKAMRLLVKQLTPSDRVAIVVYAGASGLVLPSTSCDEPDTIVDALDRLRAGGSTNGGDGIRLAYAEAMKNFIDDGVNRVILCTDGDFNVGVTSPDALVEMVKERAREGVFLTVLGFGMGNYKDSTLEQIANKGNGNYAYIDSFSEARKNLVEQAAGTLFTIAKDVKLQIEFNPAVFEAYRLIGYENRVLAKEDFNNDKKDAGELGAGHTVTAFYELVPKGSPTFAPPVDPLKYQPEPTAEPVREETGKPADSSEWLTVKLRWKLPDENQSTKIEIPYTGTLRPFVEAAEDFRFAAGVAAAGMLMRHDSYVNDITYDRIIEWTVNATGSDPSGYRREFIDLLRNAQALQ
jgi:Ca-activated chloride channel family protein